MAAHRLLILDDDETVGNLFVFVAQRAGFEAKLCARPQPFFAAIDEWVPTHLAIDLAMPEMSGLEVIRALAGCQCSARIIVSSGAGSAESQAALEEARRLGLRTVGVLSKPFSLSSLRSLLAKDDAPGTLRGSAV